MIKICVLICLLMCPLSLAVAAAPRAETAAGTGNAENNGDQGAAAEINIGEPFGVEIGPDGALYITEVRNHRVLRLDLKTRQVTTVAGCGRRGYSGDGGPALDAELNEPYEVRFDRDGNMFFVEMKNHIVRRVDAKTKRISTIAGAGRQGFGGDGGPATAALLSQPHSIALDRTGAVYIADIGNHRIRRVDPQTGVIESIAGNSERKPPREGQPATGNPMLGPRALFIDGDEMWIALREGHSVWRMNLADRVLHHIAGTGKAGYSGDGEPAARATFNGPKGIAVVNGQVFVTDAGNNVIRQIDSKTGRVATIAGRSPAANKSGKRPASPNAALNQPHGVCASADGAVYIGDTANHRVIRVTSQ
jgi:streptogramin lyase